MAGRMANRLKESLVAWVAWVKANVRGPYRFSPRDCRLYLSERKWTPSVVRVVQETPLCTMEIEDCTFYWPAAFGINGLAWLYDEVFQPWSKNPSSYAHPNLWRETPEWVIDAGACEGFFSLFALDHGGKRVLAVEPVPELVNALRATFRKELVGGRLTILPFGLAATQGTMSMSLDHRKPWETLVSNGLKSDSAERRVQTTTLDALSCEYGLGAKGLIKMDVEGAEMDALSGATELMAAHRPRLAIAVYHGHKHALRCRDIILRANSTYTIEFRGFYGWHNPPRPYLLFAW